MSTQVEKAMLAVDRGKFVKEDPYDDMLQDIGYGVEVSAPHMVKILSLNQVKILTCSNAIIHLQHAYALEILSDHLKAGNRALDVGSGSGYVTACMAVMVRV